MSDTTRETVVEVIINIGVICLILELGTLLVFWLGPFSLDRTYAEVALGFLIGAVFAALIFWHMGITIEGTMELEEKSAVNRSRMLSVLRTLGVFVGMVLAYLTGWVNLVSMLVGILTLKLAAYLQPLTHKITGKEEKHT